MNDYQVIKNLIKWMHTDEAIIANLSLTGCVSTGLVGKMNNTSLAAGSILFTALLSRHFRMSTAVSLS